MFSIILPTLWKLDYREELQKIHDSSFVGEVILINNDRKNTPDWFLKMHLPKLIDVRVDENIFVNPAWNLGVRMAKYEHCLLFSDDVVVDSYDFLEQTDNYLRDKDVIIGCSEQCYTMDTTCDFQIVDQNGVKPFGYGSIMAFRKESYRPIPEFYKIWYGDTLMFGRYRDAMPCGAKSFVNLGMKKSKMTLTSGIFSDVCAADDRHNFQNNLSEYIK
jgi:GT2 family glycosyltransferase